jgi:RNA polymerase sigma-70 factor (ECF subfamily)
MGSTISPLSFIGGKMNNSTCWVLIDAAARGDLAARAEFAQRYEGPVRAFLAARWRDSPLLQELDDAAQEVFVACLKEGGALERVDPERPGGFRSFLCGVARNVARELERRRSADQARRAGEGVAPEELIADEPSLSAVFDRAWARAIMHQAGQRQRQRAEEAGAEALRRVELLRLRFGDAQPIRDIARQWGVEAAHLHREYARARQEFRSALEEVVALHLPGSAAQIDEECRKLLALLA